MAGNRKAWILDMDSFKIRKYKCHIWILMAALLLSSLAGCGKNSIQTETVSGIENAGTELLEPVGVANNYDVAGFRDIYITEVYSSNCAPSVTEFAYTPDVAFDKYGKMPGESVVPGDVLVYGDTGGLDESLKELTKELEQKVEDYEDQVSDLQEDIYDAKVREYEASVPYMESISNAPDEDSGWYSSWARFSMPAEGAYKGAVLAREQVEQTLKEKQELFALEREYDLGRLERLGDTINDACIISNTDGTVVAMNAYSSGDYIQKNTNIIAIGDLKQKILLTDYIGKSKIEKAQDVYALIDGKRYEIVYENMEKEEYSRLKKLNDEVFTTFYLVDPNDEIPMGKFATVVVVEDARKNTLAVMSDAVHRNGDEYYCYLYDEGNSVKTSIEVGITDGVYTEILAGINEGDKVLVNEMISAKGKMISLEKGAVSGEYKGTGFLYYPSTEWIDNPAKHGTFYIKEVCVERYQQVTAGEALVKIEVFSDEIEVGRINRKIQRQQERLARLLDEKSKIYSDEINRSLDRAIEARQKNIEDLNEELAELTQYAGEVILTAPYAGIITNVTELEAGDLVSTNQKLVQIADQTRCYVIVEDGEGQLSYGNEATITYIGENSIKKDITGTVVSVNRRSLSKQLRIGVAMIALSEEDTLDIAKHGSAFVSGGGWNRSRFDVKAEIRDVDNVLLVPKRAVLMINKNTFVKIKTQEGNVTYARFVSGGADQDNYWVVDGLSEGMEICLE